MEAKSLQNKGLTGIIAFWMIIFNFVMPLCTAAFSIYWLILLSNKVWLKSVGISLFVSNIFIVFLSLASFAFHIMSILKIKLVFDQMAFQLFIITTIVSFVVCCVSLSLSSYSSADRAYQDIIDYCVRQADKQYVIQFFEKQSTFVSQKNFILQRTVEANSILSGFFGGWLGLFVIYVISFHFLKEKDDGQPLLNGNDDNVNSQHTFDSNHEADTANNNNYDNYDEASYSYSIIDDQAVNNSTGINVNSAGTHINNADGSINNANENINTASGNINNASGSLNNASANNSQNVS